jgi:hypothetical protein
MKILFIIIALTLLKQKGVNQKKILENFRRRMVYVIRPSVLAKCYLGNSSLPHNPKDRGPIFLDDYI